MKLLTILFLTLQLAHADFKPTDRYPLTYFDVLMQRLGMLELDLHGKFYEVGFFQKNSNSVIVVIEKTPRLEELERKGLLKTDLVLKQAIAQELDSFKKEVREETKRQVEKLKVKGVAFIFQDKLPKNY
ncbi:MAG: hypothetical protein HN509_14895 [Halobacteriovoraceae bacterium]|nr:hypothetical protein [Halobacteriovoraceae bacterium]MBT5094949.1 hypothetical protein [Halobacteriovoraceae bacterium]